MKFYVLIHFAFPAFISGPEADDDDPQAFDTHKAAYDIAEQQTFAKRLGYTIIAWDDEQGGEGIVDVVRGSYE